MIGTELQLNAYQARNFKAFVDTGWIEIKPLTLFFGHNSSGKSALLSVLPMLQQTMDDPNYSTPFVFASETAGVDLGTYDEVSYRHLVSLESPVWFNLEVKLIEVVADEVASLTRNRVERLRKGLDELRISGSGVRVHVAASYNQKRRHTAITDYRLTDLDDNLILRTYRKTTAETQEWHVESPFISTQGQESRMSWVHFLPYLRGGSSGLPKASRPLYDVLMGTNSILESSLERITHIGPLRASPNRAYRLTGESPKDVGQAGQYWLSILFQSPAKDLLTRIINYWLQRLGYTLRIEWGKQGYVHPMLKDGTGLEVALKDVGFGISQLLPVLIQGLTSPPGTILILEQPEIHLHPRAQADLGDMLLSIAGRGIRLLIETHSEHLLLRIRRRLAENQLSDKSQPSLSPEDVAIYFVERQEQGSSVHRVAVDAIGNITDPSRKFQSFFSDDYEEVLKLSQAVARITREAADASGA